MVKSFEMIIGRNEFIDFPELVLNVPAKIDTGAFRSSIHCASVRETTVKGEKILRVELLGHPAAPVVYPKDFTEYRKVSITNSFGQQEERFEVDLRVKVGPKIFTTPFTLADRSGTLFPILVGRKMLRKRFLVDVTKTGVDRLKLKKDFNISLPNDEEDLE